jgi:hypothetical protein
VALFAFVALTALPVLAGALLGRRRGARGLLRLASGHLAAALAGALVATLGFALGWFRPFGLLTPMALGALAVLLAQRIARRVRLPHRGDGDASSPAGALLGAVCGAAAAAAGWCALPLCTLPFAPCGRDAAACASGPFPAVAALFEVAHRGFLRHLPVVGAVSDEIQALCTVLRASPEQQRSLAEARGWRQLVELPAMQDALGDDELLAEVARVRDGSLLALCRLQAHPRVLDLAGDPAVQELIAGLRPTALAAALAARP